MRHDHHLHPNDRSLENVMFHVEKVLSYCLMNHFPFTLFGLKEYFDGDQVDHSSEPPSAKGLAVFRDPNAVNGIKRTATSINWHPDGPTKIAVSYR